MNLRWAVSFRNERPCVSSGCLLVDLVLARVTTVFRVARRSYLGAAKEDTEVLVQMRQQHARTVRFPSVSQRARCESYYWFEVVLPSEGLFIISGAAPPSSRKLTATPALPPSLVDARPPSKYGRRLTVVPLKVPVARIPGTLMPTFGLV